jgi:hypothetical protein
MSGTNQEDPAAPQGSGGTDGLPAKRGPFAYLLLVFFCWHGGFLIFSIIPRAPGQEDPGNPAMDFYRLLTAGRQVWNMFETIPVLHSLDVRLEGLGEKEGKITAGCLLPGFKPCPTPEQPRYYVLFHRLLLTPGGAAFREAYLRKAAQLFPARPGFGVGAGPSLVMDARYTRNLYHIRRDGRVSLWVTKSFAPDGTVEDSP